MTDLKKILVTGGLGFIGTNFVNHLIANNFTVFNVDKATYASSDFLNIKYQSHCNYKYFCEDISDETTMDELIADISPDVIINLAAESHVDRSIESPRQFLQTNILGTYSLLEAIRKNFEKNKNVRFIQVSTDEVFGSINEPGEFNEKSPINPSSPYSASKASGDLLTSAWFKTFRLPVIITNCSNNYGPFQSPEKFIPKTIVSILEGQDICIYGDGKNARDWIHVDDHSRALLKVLSQGVIGSRYLIGQSQVQSNLDVAGKICDVFVLDYPKTNHQDLSVVGIALDMIIVMQSMEAISLKVELAVLIDFDME